MRFVDEAVIDVEAGKGGDGALSFHRARNVARASRMAATAVRADRCCWLAMRR